MNETIVVANCSSSISDSTDSSKSINYAESDTWNICAIEFVLHTVLSSTHALHEKFLRSIVWRASSVFREIINKYFATYTYFVKLEIATSCKIYRNYV